MFKMILLVLIAIISFFLIVLSIEKINNSYKEKKISSLVRFSLIYISLLIPILGYILTLQFCKKEKHS